MASTNSITKHCPKCKEVKPLQDFNTDRSRKLGVSSYCRKCNQAHWRTKNPTPVYDIEDLPNETWADIPDFEGLYSASNKGRIKTFPRPSNRLSTKIMQPRLMRGGYHWIQLVKDGTPKWFPVHRLILLAFVGKPPKGKPHVNHLDCNRQNNVVENLEWCSPQDNSNHRKQMGNVPRGEAIKITTLKNSDIPDIRKMLSDGILQKHIATLYGVSNTTINRIALNKNWKGF